jgi:hypothetical protein
MALVNSYDALKQALYQGTGSNSERPYKHDIYPRITDLLYIIQAVYEDLDTLAPTDWTSMSGIDTGTWDMTLCQYRKVGDIVYFKGYGENTASPAYSVTETMFTLPEGFRPPTGETVILRLMPHSMAASTLFAEVGFVSIADTGVATITYNNEVTGFRVDGLFFATV